MTVEFRPIDRSQHELLIVNDDPASRYATARLLSSAGFRIREAATGADGLRLADGDVSAIVLDVHLPDIHGFELCRQLRSRESTSRLPVLHLSAAYVTDEDKVRGLDAGADAYLTHPVEPAVLVATVQALVRTRVAEEAMRRSEAKFKAIYAQVPGGICLLDSDGRFLDVNPAMLRLLARAPDEVIGARLADFVDADALERVRRLIASTSGGHAYDEFAVSTGPGHAVKLGWNVTPHVEAGISMALVTDLSERDELERQRQQTLAREREARTAAEQLSRMKDEFIAVLSHELRTPLTAMTGWVHVLRKGASDPRMIERATAAIERNTQLQATLISDLLDMSSMTLGKTRLNLGSIDVGELAEATAAGVRTSFEASGSTLVVSLHRPYPMVRADPNRVQQIVSNLLSNALKFSPDGGEVRVDVSAHAGGVQLRVVDQGQGITPEFLPFLFDRFSQADAGSNRRRGGLGLGLSITRHLVESHGGTITVDSGGLGRGATFSVWLPVTAGSESATGGTVPADAGGLAAVDDESVLDGLDLLVVDDDADVCALLQIILGDRGARVRVAHDYEAALAALAAKRPDVLISDIGMPGRDGYDLIAEVRRREAAGGDHTPAIALTSFARTQDVAQTASAGFDLHLAKPLQPLRLIRHIVRLAASRG